jgi:hypothetical protein
MEIHQHTKNPAGHKENKWSHRFWEFFMLFLAITLGFFVDNQREHYLEGKREKRYMHMMIDDLRADIKENNRNDSARLIRQNKLDTLINLLGNKITPDKTNDLYRLVIETDSYESFLRNSRTIQELKNAGGMRMIANKDVSAFIIEYDNFITAEVDWNNKTEASRIDYYKQIRFQLLNTQSLFNLTTGKQEQPLILLAASPVTVNTISGALFQVKRISETCRESGKIAKEKAEHLITLIKKEYHLK